MRDLLLLRGVPGCGKSTFIKDNNLTPYTICPDNIRLMFDSPVFDPETGKKSISQKQNKRVWKMVYDLAEEKMKRGEFIVIDAMNIDVSAWKPYAEKYRYKIYVKNFNVSLETCLKQNLMRDEYKQVPEEVIEKNYEKLISTSVPKYATEIDSVNELVCKPVDCNNYENIYVFGDIHGCFAPIKEFFDSNPFSEKNLYLFLGDYLDRGFQNKEVLEFLVGFTKNKNVLFLEGNHNYEKYFANDEFEKIKSSEFKKNTVPQILSVDKKKVREWCRRWMQMSYFTFNGKNYLASHAGFGFFNERDLKFIPSVDFIKGGKYEEDVDLWWENKFADSENPVIQIHGHRNIYEYPVDKFKTSFNLNSAVEFGEKLRVMKISRQGYEFLHFDNPSCEGRENPWKKNKLDWSAKNEVVKKMKESEDIVEKDLGNGVSSFNFKRDVFFKDRWNEINSIARGLFVNTEDSSIMARSYIKFFNFMEGNKNSVEFLKENLKFPVTAYEKYNGFLGLLSYNKKTDDFFFASKSTNSSDFAKWFRNIFTLSVGKNDYEWIKNYLKNNNSTMIFEVIDPINDPHIIKYDCQKIILLDVMKNNFNTEKVDYETLKFIGMRTGLKVKKLVETFDDFEVMLDFINYNGNKIEGYVIEDLNGYMFKAKTDYYLFWKSCRRIKDDLIKGKKIDKSRFSKSQIEVLDFMKSLPDLNEKSIIQVREEFMSEKEKNKMPF